jgi:hypothetical protein
VDGAFLPGPPGSVGVAAHGQPMGVPADQPVRPCIPEEPRRRGVREAQPDRKLNRARR